ncbi:MAG: DnaJ domain-containing protein [Elusimicrobiales bacterium]|nr:DnaJ domain-containing protein [Elusimicrobiales bacterium]
MSNYINSQNIPNFKSLVSVEHILKGKIVDLMKMIIKEEKKLYSTALKFLAIKETLERFYSNYYLKKLGVYLSILDDLKKRFFGEKNNNVFKKESDVKKDCECDEKELKKIYRQLAKIYHPDRYDLLSEDEKEFLKIRMAEVNKYFEKKDILSLKNMLEQAKIELSDEISSVDRIKMLNIRLKVVKELTAIYEEKIDTIKNDEIYRLIEMSEEERIKEIEKKKDLLLSEIEVYVELIKRTERYLQK